MHQLILLEVKTLPFKTQEPEIQQSVDLYRGRGILITSNPDEQVANMYKNVLSFGVTEQEAFKKTVVSKLTVQE